MRGKNFNFGKRYFEYLDKKFAKNVNVFFFKEICKKNSTFKL